MLRAVQCPRDVQSYVGNHPLKSAAGPSFRSSRARTVANVSVGMSLAITLDLSKSKGAATVVATSPVISEVATCSAKLSS